MDMELSHMAGTPQEHIYTPCHKSPSDHNVYLFPKDRQQNAFSNASFKQANSYLPSYQIQREKGKDLVLQQGWKKNSTSA